MCACNCYQGKTKKDTKGTKYNLFGDGTKKGKGSSHITYAVRAPIMPKVFACAKRLGQAAVRLAECVDRFVTRARANRTTKPTDAALYSISLPSSSRGVPLLSLVMSKDERFGNIDAAQCHTHVDAIKLTHALPPIPSVVFNKLPSMVSTPNTELIEPTPTKFHTSTKRQMAATVAQRFGEPEPDHLGYNMWNDEEFPRCVLPIGACLGARSAKGL